MELFDLSGQVAVVTGSSRGIGRAIAERLAEHGAKVVISSRKIAPCQDVANAINARHGPDRAMAVAANLSSKSELQVLIDATRAHWGRIDVMVCNAASNPYYGPMAGISDEQFRKILDNNIVSHHWLVSMVAPEMTQRRSGSIVIISSIGGLRGSPIIGAYCISKAADMQLARNLAVELGPHNVRVNSISPGYTRTKLVDDLLKTPEGQAILPHWMGMTPMARMGEVTDLQGAVVYLACEASDFMTGSDLIVDGGYCAW